MKFKRITLVGKYNGDKNEKMDFDALNMSLLGLGKGLCERSRGKEEVMTLKLPSLC